MARRPRDVLLGLEELDDLTGPENANSTGLVRGFVPVSGFPITCDDRHEIISGALSSGIHSDPSNLVRPKASARARGEEQAIRYLQARGWDVVAHRFRVGRIELDLIARRGHLVAFVEVKARRGTASAVRSRPSPAPSGGRL